MSATCDDENVTKHIDARTVRCLLPRRYDTLIGVVYATSIITLRCLMPQTPYVERYATILMMSGACARYVIQSVMRDAAVAKS